MSGAVVLLIVFLVILLLLLGAAVLVLISVWSGGRGGHKKSSDRESGRGGGLFADKRMCLGFRVERPADRKTAELLEIMIDMMDTIRGKMICDDEVKRGIMRAIDDMKLEEGDGFCDAKSFAAASEEVKELRMLAPQISALQKLVCEDGRIGVHEFKGMLRGFVEAVCYD
jgi:hypothetical protein